MGNLEEFIEQPIIRYPLGWKTVKSEGGVIKLPYEFSRIIGERNASILSESILYAKWDVYRPLVELFDPYIRMLHNAESDEMFAEVPIHENSIFLEFDNHPYDTQFEQDRLIMCPDPSRKYLQLWTEIGFMQQINAMNVIQNTPFENLNFCGEEDVSIDNKGRFIIPAKFRRIIARRNINPIGVYGVFLENHNLALFDQHYFDENGCPSRSEPSFLEYRQQYRLTINSLISSLTDDSDWKGMKCTISPSEDRRYLIMKPKNCSE